MEGLVPTGKGDGFELFRAGKKVAEGHILPGDLNHLREILEMKRKYGEGFA